MHLDFLSPLFVLCAFASLRLKNFMLLRMPPSWAGEFVALPESDALEHTLEMAGVGVKERGATPDETWTLEITSNRGDLLSAQGLARELGAMENQPVRSFATGSEKAVAAELINEVRSSLPAACRGTA